MPVVDSPEQVISVVITLRRASGG